jgi:hypothetical protein
MNVIRATPAARLASEVVRGVPTRIRLKSNVHTGWGQRVPPDSRLACAAGRRGGTPAPPSCVYRGR